MPVSKVKQANKKWRHDQKRRQKARSERVHKAQLIEKRGRQKNERRQVEADYVSDLRRDLGY